MAEHAILFFNALSPVHNGSGDGVGFIDNPILRERVTGFPLIQAPSIKGTLRDLFGPDNDPTVQALFGPPVGHGDSHAGAVNFGDAQILAFPIRSLRGGFVWATSPLVLCRLWRMVQVTGKENNFQGLKNLVEAIDPAFGNADWLLKVCPSGVNELSIGPSNNRKVILEEFPLDPDPFPKLGEFATEVSDIIFPGNPVPFIGTLFRRRLVLLPENAFAYFVVNATEVTPNIRIEPNGVTSTGSLRYTEYLPSEAILFSIVRFEKANVPARDAVLATSFRSTTVAGEKCDLTAKYTGSEAVKKLFFERIGHVVQIGGDETTGKGLMELNSIK